MAAPAADFDRKLINMFENAIKAKGEDRCYAVGVARHLRKARGGRRRFRLLR